MLNDEKFLTPVSKSKFIKFVYHDIFSFLHAMEKALKNSLQIYERENRCYVLIKKQIDTLFTPKEIEELNLLAEKNIKDNLLSL